MTETSTDPASKQRFDFPQVFAMFLHPRNAFEAIVASARSTWQTPMLVLSLSGILSVVVSGFFKAQAASMGVTPLPVDFQYWTPEMQANYYQAQQAMSGPTFVYIIPLVGTLTMLWLGWLALSGLLHLTSTLLGGRGSMGGALNVVAWASLPFALRDILRILFMLIVQRAITSPGLSGFASGAGFWAQLISHLDVFLIWQALLLAVGFCLADGLSRNKAIAGVVGILVLILLAQAGLGMLAANLGGLAVQRPFF